MTYEKRSKKKQKSHLTPVLSPVDTVGILLKLLSSLSPPLFFRPWTVHAFPGL